MQFRTIIPPADPPFYLSHQQKILSIGSCFAENIGEKLIQAKFPLHLNPFGIVYNPLSIASCITAVSDSQPYDPSTLFEHNGLWYDYNRHGRFSGPDKQAVIQQISGTLQDAQQFAVGADCLLLTLGSAHVHIEKAQNKIVANCHKMPGSLFFRRRLSLDEVISSLDKAFQQWWSVAPGSKIICTVSPVRHWRDGAIENQRSKATLIMALAALSEQYPEVYYFPAYELMMDDLRDYRFYATDMLHPSPQAIEYIWEYFSHTFFEKNTLVLIEQIQQLQRALAHKPFNPNTMAHQTFIATQRIQLENLKVAHPYLDFSEETALLTPAS